MSKRTTIPIHGKPFWVERRADGTFKNVVDIGKALSKDIRQHANRVVKPGYGHLGDQKRRGK
jgi:hypothetical protein